MVVDGDREGALGGLLADHVLLQDLVDLARFRQVLELDATRRRRELLVDDLIAEVDALVADVDPGAGDELFDLALRLAAEAAEELLVGIGRTCQRDPSLRAVVAYRRRVPKLRGDRKPACRCRRLRRWRARPFPRALACGRTAQRLYDATDRLRLVSDQDDSRANGDRAELGVADLVARVRDELETLDASRDAADRPALFSLDELELELQFTAIERVDGRGGIDLKVVSLGASKGLESTAVQKIRLRFVLEEAARRAGLLGSRAHSSQSDGSDVKDVVPVDGLGDDPG
jgi:hypothetical protein